MSKYSISQQRVEKIQDNILEQLKKDALGQNDDLTPQEAQSLPGDLFCVVEHSERDAEDTGFSNYSYWRSTLRMLFKNRMAVFTLSVMLILVVFTILQPYLPGQRDPNLINSNPETGMPLSNKAPNSDFWFGTNAIGQDLWARIWAGTRTSLFIGLTVAVVQAIVGITIGMLWGYVRKLDFFFTELYNIINNIPTTIVLILASYILRPSVRTMILAMCVTSWIVLARFIRNLVVIIRDQDFNVASRCLGSSLPKIILRNLLPQMVSVVMLRMALTIPEAIGQEVFLTYIGLGVPVETPSLGNLINTGRALMMSASLRYQLIYPAVILSVITICFYLTGNAFADAADPKNHL